MKYIVFIIVRIYYYIIIMYLLYNNIDNLIPTWYQNGSQWICERSYGDIL